MNSLKAYHLAETFTLNIHFAVHDHREQVAVDLGARVSDTALSCGNEGERIYGLESDLENYAALTRNLFFNFRPTPQAIPLQLVAGENG